MNAHPTEIRLSEDVRKTLARQTAGMHRAATSAARSLFVLNAVYARTGTPLFAGIGLAEKARRRAVGKRQRAARKIARRG